MRWIETYAKSYNSFQNFIVFQKKMIFSQFQVWVNIYRHLGASNYWNLVRNNGKHFAITWANFIMIGSLWAELFKVIGVQIKKHPVQRSSNHKSSQNAHFPESGALSAASCLRRQRWQLRKSGRALRRSYWSTVKSHGW